MLLDFCAMVCRRDLNVTLLYSAMFLAIYKRPTISSGRGNRKYSSSPNISDLLKLASTLTTRLLFSIICAIHTSSPHLCCHTIQIHNALTTPSISSESCLSSCRCLSGRSKAVRLDLLRRALGAEDEGWGMGQLDVTIIGRQLNVTLVHGTNG